MQIIKAELERVYVAELPRIYKFFLYRTLSKEVAEDLSSATFLRVADLLAAGKGEGVEDMRSYVLGIARFVFMDYLRYKYKMHIINLEAEQFEQLMDNTIEEINDDPSLEEKLERILQLLPEKQKEVISLRLLEKLNLEEIAIRLKKDKNYVKTTQRRALRNLERLAAMKDVYPISDLLNEDHE